MKDGPPSSPEDATTEAAGDEDGGGGTPPARPPANPYRGVRMRKWGTWVAEIREPRKKGRIWLGSYASPVAAARAYDTASLCLRGPAARLNFPRLAGSIEIRQDMSVEDVRRKAAEVGARVDAFEAGLRSLREGLFQGFRRAHFGPDLDLIESRDLQTGVPDLPSRFFKTVVVKNYCTKHYHGRHRSIKGKSYMD
ncbi:ethylene-responsive transcription factor ERF010-like isoform X2 [Nymphaea colorata]|uniref:ethylene-responsive transcription factor ERF010-like isoform X2 n=1 Tax=Nymphaea colorata TaxID=210225 RepID=UPI00214F1815|nr:ethylene-responsive transcription factor ERF010-like isoform X2 [Nymphaea colorata]